MFSINTSTPAGLIYCALIALGFGILTAFVYAIKSNYSKNMLITLVILPVIVDVVLTIINGSIGVGIAIAGTFVPFQALQKKFATYSFLWPTDLCVRQGKSVTAE